MRKRISCKVIRTIPLSKNSDTLHHASRPSNRSHKINDAAGTPNTKRCVWEPAVNAQVKYASNTVTYTDQLDITRVPINDSLTAQILDCYV